MNNADVQDNKEAVVAARPTVVIEIPNTQLSPQDDFYLYKQVTVEITGDDHDTATISLPPQNQSPGGAGKAPDSFLANLWGIMDIETPISGRGCVHSPNKRSEDLNDLKVVVLTRRGEGLIRACFFMACLPIVAAIVAILYVVITRVRKG